MNLAAKPLHLLYICRRFGPVGGMERYVWCLCREMAALGHRVEVLCEVDACTESLLGVEVHVLGAVHPKPRWLAHLRFSARVDAWVQAHPASGRIIHSHERTHVHHITTAHGPPFASVRQRPWWKRVSLRIAVNLWLEQREFCGVQVRRVIPNSDYISQQLQCYYPNIGQRMTQAIVPGVDPCAPRPAREVSLDGGVVGFIGKEWKRKGLPQVLDVLSELVKKRPQIRLLLAGAEQTEVAALLRSLPFDVQVLGRVEPHDFYAQLDVLLHPAVHEPYGMVITEALSAGVPVVISDVCGAAPDVQEHLGQVIFLHAPLSRWVQAVDQELGRDLAGVSYRRSWLDMAQEHVVVYQAMQESEAR